MHPDRLLGFERLVDGDVLSDEVTHRIYLRDIHYLCGFSQEAEHLCRPPVLRLERPARVHALQRQQRHREALQHTKGEK